MVKLVWVVLLTSFPSIAASEVDEYLSTKRIHERYFWLPFDSWEFKIEVVSSREISRPYIKILLMPIP